MKYLKALVGVVGVGLGVLAQYQDSVPEQYRPYVTAAIGLATALGVYHVKYVPAAAPAHAAADGEAGVIDAGN